MAFIALAVFGVLGWSLALSRSENANAQSNMAVDQATLDTLYNTVFHRPIDDSGRGFHLGRDLKDVLRDFSNSQEMRHYGALFKAVKSYEEAQRAPGTLTAEEKESHLHLIDSALSNLLAWVETLPQQDPCMATVTPEHAREAIEAAHDSLNAVARTAAENGVFHSTERTIHPREIVVHPKCLRPMHSVSPSPSPVHN